MAKLKEYTLSLQTGFDIIDLARAAPCKIAHKDPRCSRRVAQIPALLRATLVPATVLIYLNPRLINTAFFFGRLNPCRNIRVIMISP